MLLRSRLALSAAALSVSIAFAAPAVAAQAAANAAGAAAFVTDAEAQLDALYLEAAAAAWVQANFITADTQRLATLSGQRSTALQVRLATEAKRFDATAGIDPVVRRKLDLLKRGITMPSPKDPKLGAELAGLQSELKAAYGTAKYCKDGTCLDVDDLNQRMKTSRDPAVLLDAWTGWHATSPKTKASYARLVEIGNQGARELGYSDVGAMWRGGYDMAPDAFAADIDRLWSEVRPLYEALHCHVRGRLNETYGDAVAPKTGPIPAHLLGNMWAQEWGAIFDLVAPPDATPAYDLTERLTQQNYDAVRMTKTAEGFFTSLGFDKLPPTFWERSLLTKPRDREVVCHASAWDLDDKDDIRIKMCMRVNEEDFRVIHHELGHNIYQRAYKDQPKIFRGAPNDGFHEAIGDMVALSATPSYLKRLGLIDAEPDASKDLGLLMRQALDKVAFLPFGLLIDKWRWQVFSGEVKPADYDRAWWQLRERVQGVKRPVAASADSFDPGAKYHVPGGTPYMRYFLAHILQFQFHRAACAQAGDTGPLHRCSIYGNEAVGKRFNAMLSMGASKPWPDALQAFTGERRIDATAVLAYFAPLKTWLDQQNKTRSCGW